MRTSLHDKIQITGAVKAHVPSPRDAAIQLSGWHRAGRNCRARLGSRPTRNLSLHCPVSEHAPLSNGATFPPTWCGYAQWIDPCPGPKRCSWGFLAVLHSRCPLAGVVGPQ